MNIMVIGCGYWGSKLLNRFETILGDWHVTACDIRYADPHYSSRFAVCADYKLAIWDAPLDAVAIATPIETHYQIVRDCLEAGKHVLVEKPLSTRSDTARELVGLAMRKQRVLSTDLTFLFDERLERATGDIRSLLWTGPGSDRSDSNVLWTWGPHPMSILVSRYGMPTNVYPIKCERDELSCIYAFSHKWVFLHMKRHPDEQRRRDILFTGGILALSDPPASEPLMQVCRQFVSDVDGNNFENTNLVLSAQVVEALEWTELAARAEQSGL